LPGNPEVTILLLLTSEWPVNREQSRSLPTSGLLWTNPAVEVRRVLFFPYERTVGNKAGDFMDEIEVYKELGTYERHFNQMQSVCRSLASTWLLATFAGIGYIFEKFTANYGSTGVRLAAALV